MANVTFTGWRESDDDDDVWTVHVGFGGSRWPAAEQAGLVNAGGMWMTPEGLEKWRALKAKEREGK